jgi:hypothetical protein
MNVDDGEGKVNLLKNVEIGNALLGMKRSNKSCKVIEIPVRESGRQRARKAEIA